MSRQPLPPILKTKLLPPAMGRFHIKRERLINLLNAENDRQIVLVCAPAGYGKTTALVELSEGLSAEGTAIVWVSLDGNDNDPVRLAAHLWTAFNLQEGSTRALGRSLEHVVIHIINHLLQSPTPFALILDDYHLITSPEVHAAIALLLEKIPPSLRVIIGSRAEPPLHVARLRTQNRLADIRAADLRFTTDEIRAFCKDTLGIAPSINSMKHLEYITEGWAVGLQLAALTLRRPSTTVTDEVIGSLATQLSGAMPVFTYLAEEVLSQLAPELQQFLLITSILNRFTSNLCRAVSRDCMASHYLRDLEHADLFMVLLDKDEGWYRYHHLFADFLRAKLHDTYPELVGDLHGWAAEWYATEGDIREAMYHAFASGDHDLAADLFVYQGWDALTPRGEIETLWVWAEQFPQETIQKHPRLILYFARLCQLIGESEKGRRLLLLAERILDKQAVDDSASRGNRSILASYQSLYEAYAGHPLLALELARRADGYIPEDDTLFRVRQANTFGFIYYVLGEIESARQAYNQAMMLARQHKHHYLLLDSAFFLGVTNSRGGALHDIERLSSSLLDEYGMDFGPVCSVIAPLCNVYLEWDRLDEAQSLLEHGLALARRERLRDVEWAICIVLALVLVTRNEEDRAKQLLEEGLQAAGAVGSSVVMSIARAFQVRVLLAIGDLASAQRWADSYVAAGRPEYPDDIEQIALAHVLVATNRSGPALTILDSILRPAREGGRRARVLETQILRTLILERQGRPTEAESALAEAVCIGEPEGYMRTFINAGPDLLPVLRRIIKSAPEYITRLIRAFPTESNAAGNLDALTDRELEVLALIAEGATNQEIADWLVVSLGTVKSHTNHILSKLGARNRTEAVALARERLILV